MRGSSYWNTWKMRATKSFTSQVPIRVDYEAAALGHELIVKFQPSWSWCGKGRSVHSLHDIALTKQVTFWFKCLRPGDALIY